MFFKVPDSLLETHLITRYFLGLFDPTFLMPTDFQGWPIQAFCDQFSDNFYLEIQFI